jgi:putative ABC transport system permease protein
MWRDLLLNKAQFISIFLISLLAVGFYTGITAEYRSMDVSARSFFAQTHLATVWVYGADLTADDVAAVEALEDVEDVERVLVYETQAQLPASSASPEGDGAGDEGDASEGDGAGDEGAASEGDGASGQGASPELTLHYREGGEVNALLVEVGEPFSVDDEGIWLDTRFAEARGLAVGDSLGFAVEGVAVTARIAGLVYSPELVYPDLGDAMTPDYGAHGFAYTGAGNFPLEEIVAGLAAQAEGAPAGDPAPAADPAVPAATPSDPTSAADPATSSTPAARPASTPALPYNQMIVYAPVWEERQYELEAALRDELGDKAATTIVQQDHPTFLMLQNECEQHAMFADIFPVLFILIAILVMLSTMSRLVTKQSTLIGTMKALGVPKAAITAHYIGYGFIITLAGGLVGAVLGPPLVPQLFLPSMTRFFTLPSFLTYREPFFLILPVLIALAGALVSWLSCRRVLAQKPATAMRPRAPRTARHSPLEVLPFWRRLNPNIQLNERDIRRNKLRSAMSAIGSMSVSALLLVAFFSLSILNVMAEWQYGLINNFGSRATLSEGISDETRDALIERWDATPIMERAIELRLPGDTASRVQSSLQVLEDSDLIRLTDLDGRIIPLEDDTVYLSKGAAKALGLDVGDPFEWHLYGETGWHEATVDVLNRNPMVQGLTLSPDTLTGLGLTFEPSVIVSAQMIDASDAGVQSVTSATETSEGLDLMIEAVTTMAVTMITAAVLIGILIMYNLGTLAFNEMERELATLKVVGFKRRQIVALLSSQNFLLSLLGFIPGIPLGWLVAILMLSTGEGTFDYPAALPPSDVLLVLAMVLALCALVSLLFIRKVARLDMVASLKSPE